MSRKTPVLIVFLLMSFAVPTLFAQYGESRQPATAVAAGAKRMELPPAAAREWMRLRSPSDATLSAAHVPIQALGAYGLSMTGTVGYSITGYSARLTADKVENTSSTRTSGTLRMDLWMSDEGYRGSGYHTAVYQLGTLGPGYYFSAVDSGPITFNTPPTGCYYVTMLLEEWNGTDYNTYVDYRDFTDHQVSINNGCGTATYCSYSLYPSSSSVSSSGGSGSFTVTGSPSGCSGSWSASSSYSWISVTSGGAGSGSGSNTVNYYVQANNSTSSRTGTINVAGQSFTITQSGVTTSCVERSDQVCLMNGRFGVRITYDDGSGPRSATAIRYTPDTALFWFYSSNNIEILLKMVNACSYNSRFWVYSGGTTDDGVTIYVSDSLTGMTRTYQNVRGQKYLTITDSSAFATCP